MKFSLHHLARYPEPAQDLPPLLILFHGVGSNEYDLFSMAQYLDPRFLLLSARAPYPLGSGSHAWYAVDVVAGGFKIDEQQAEASRVRILEFIPEVVEAYGADPQRVYMMGFSQGAILSMSVMLSQPEIIAGVVAMSGRIPPHVEEAPIAPERLENFPILQIHGTQDEVISVADGRAARDLLSSLPLDHTYQEFDMGHTVSNQSLGVVGEWLKNQLGME